MTYVRQLQEQTPQIHFESEVVRAQYWKALAHH